MAKKSVPAGGNGLSVEQMSKAVFGSGTEDVLGHGDEAAKALQRLDHLFRVIEQECENPGRWTCEQVKALAEIGQWYAERMNDITACGIDDMRTHAVRAGGAA